jgi:hypothetical protein
MLFFFIFFLFPGRSQVIALRRSHNDSCRKQHEARLSKHRVVHIHVMHKKRRSTHAEGAYEFEYYIASEGVMASHVFCGKLDSLYIFFLTLFFYWLHKFVVDETIDTDVNFLLATQICS